MTKLNKKLIILTSISFFIFLFSIFFSKSEKSSPKSLQTALLNPNYKESVSKITIGSKNDSIFLEKKSDFWFANNSVLVDSKLVETLISNSSKIRDIFKISENESDFEKLELSNSNSVFIEFSDSEKSFSKIFFGISDSLSNRIVFRTEQKSESYETENNFSQFLTFDLNYWSAGEIFYEIKNPQTVKLTLFNEDNSVQKTKSFNSSDENFSSVSHNILSIRHGSIFFNEINNDAKIIAILECHDGNGKIAIVEILKNNNEYLVRNKFSNNLTYEISEWTFKKIIEIFNE